MNRLVLLAALALASGPALADTPTLTLNLTFDAEAQAALSERGEMVTVSAYFYGDPAPGATAPTDPEMGWINLGAEEYRLPVAPVTLTLGQGLAIAPLDQVVAPMVNVNIFTARLTDENNLIDCGFIDTAMAELTAPQNLTCTLLK